MRDAWSGCPGPLLPSGTSSTRRAIDDVEAVAVETAPLRLALAENPVLGFLFLDRLAAVMLERLQATRIRLLDLYGTDDAG